ncbi:DUF397 domain-containing protein [Streptomyces sp. NPDC052236]|uniref:DUF397 domain-containing protein n=1 Tax=Streptomyces sp. NPDC052236 TaxID=3365686 RepID=UPI0037D85D39
MNERKADLLARDLSAASWRKSSRSGPENNCIEITDLPGGIVVRDSKDTGRGPLRFPVGPWGAFQQAVADGGL